MNRKRDTDTYDRTAVGERIQNRREVLGMTQESFAKKINRATKYCSSIERGVCGMSVETMLAIAECLDMSIDYMLRGVPKKTGREYATVEEQALLEYYLNHCDGQEKKKFMDIVRVYFGE